MKKKFIIILVVLAILIWGCSPNQEKIKEGVTDMSAKKEESTLTIWAWDESFNIKAANEAKMLYQKKYPNTSIQVVAMAQNDILKKLNTGLSSQVYENLPDIVLIEDYQAQKLLNYYRDAFANLNDDIDPNSFMENKLKISSLDGNIYGVPFDSGVATLFYRRDYIEQAGYTMADMEDLTWEEYIKIGKAVREKLGKYMLTIDPNDLGLIRIMLQSAGSWYVKEDGNTIDIKDNKALKDAITIYRQMITEDIAQPITDWDHFVSTFKNGEVASVASGCWIAPTIQSMDEQEGKWAVTKIPRMGRNKDSINSSNIGGSCWYVIDGKKNTKIAKDFITSTFGSDLDLINKLSKDINLVSSMKNVSSLKNYQLPSSFYSNQKILQLFAAYTKDIPTVNYGMHTYEIEALVTDALQLIMSGNNLDSALYKAHLQAEAAIGTN